MNDFVKPLSFQNLTECSLISAYPRQGKTRLSVQFVNEDFFRWSRPNKGFRPPHSGTGRRTRSTPQPETRGERSPAKKRPFMDGH